jgi:hypothetical protein
MTGTSGTIYRLARGRLDSIREVWDEEHRSAIACLDFEAFLQATAEVFGSFDGLFMQRRLGVLQEQIPANHDLDDRERETYRLWNDLADEINAELSSLEKDYEVQGAAEFRRCHAVGKERLANWTAVRPSKAIGLRVDELDEAAAAELRVLLEEGAKTGLGRPRLEPLSVPAGDPDLLRKRAKQKAG